MKRGVLSPGSAVIRRRSSDLTLIFLGMHGLLFPFIKFTLAYLHVVPEHVLVHFLLAAKSPQLRSGVCIQLSCREQNTNAYFMEQKPQSQT